MSTQNLNTGPLRSSGHKEATEEHAEVAHLSTRGENGDPKALLQNRLLNNPQILRAALYDHDDFLPVASSTKKFDLSPDLVRKILDGLLTYSRVGDPTAAGGAGQPPQGLNLGTEGHVAVKDGDADKMVGELKGHVFIAARTATYVLLVEGAEGANEASLATLVQSFQQGLQELTL